MPSGGYLLDGVSGVGGVSAGTTSVPSGQIVFSNSNNVSFGLNGSTVTASVGGGGGAAEYWQNVQGPIQNTTSMTDVSQSNQYVFPIFLHYPVTLGHLRFMANLPSLLGSTQATSNGATGSARQDNTMRAVLYTRGAGASSASLQYYVSAEWSMRAEASFSANATAGSQYSHTKWATVIMSTGSSSFSSSQAYSSSNIQFAQTAAGIQTRMNGGKFLEFPLTTSLPASNYWVAFLANSATTTAGDASRVSAGVGMMNPAVYAFTQLDQQWGQLGIQGVGTPATAFMSGLGNFSTNTNDTTASIPLANITTSNSNFLPWVQMFRVA